MSTSTSATATELENEIADLQNRRAELEQDALDANAALEDARAQLVEGTTDASAVTSAQAKYTALREALSSLDERIIGKQQQLGIAVEKEHRAALIAQLVQLAADGRDAWNQMQKIRSEAAGALDPFMQRLLSAYDDVLHARSNFISLASKEVPQVGRELPLKHEMYHLSDAEKNGFAAAHHLIGEVRAAGADFSGIEIPWNRESMFDLNLRQAPWQKILYGQELEQAFQSACTQRKAKRARWKPAAKPS